MAKPIKLKREEAEATFVECECGEKQTSDLIKCIKCKKLRCDRCMPLGADSACVDCFGDTVDDFDEVDF